MADVPALPELPLPDQPNLEQLRNQAKSLRRAALAAIPGARRGGARYPDAPGPGFPLRAAQLVVARRHGFASWTRLKRHVEVLSRYSRFPDRVSTDSAADTFLRLACLNYAPDDGPPRWEEAARLLEREPGIVSGNVYVAAATASVGELRRILAVDPAAASRQGGPFQWEPLCYLAYARHDALVPLDATLEVARLLLDAGADPNTSYRGTACPRRSPCSPASSAKVSSAGPAAAAPAFADSRPAAAVGGRGPQQGRAVNRMFEPENDHLELLLEFGLGTGNGGPWKSRLGDALDSPAEMPAASLPGRSRTASPSESSCLSRMGWWI